MIFVTCPTGIEQLLVDELKELGVLNARKGFRGVYVPQEMDYVYKINYCSRLATRVLYPIKQFPCKNKEDLYENAKRIPWQQYLNLKKTFAIDSNVSSPMLRNSLYASLVMKDGICDLFREKCGERPSVETQNPDVQLNLFIHEEKATISLDTSGAPLFKRGWRTESTEAPIQESLAAAILRIANYSPDEILCDPFCGSGTFLMEAAMMATHTPPGFFRKQWGFTNLPEFSDAAWKKVKAEADSRRIPLKPGIIMGADKDPKAVEMTLAHLKKAGFEGIEVVRKDIRSYYPSTSPTLVVTNPPYGIRLSVSAELFTALARFLKNRTAYILGVDEGIIRTMGMTPRRTYDLKSGGLDITLYRFG